MKNIIILLTLSLIIGCRAQSKPVFYKLNDFNIAEANKFVSKIGSLKDIRKISIIDTNREKNQFKVNNNFIFNDTLQVEEANYKSYVKLAKEIEIDKEKLNEILKTFNNIKVSEFLKKEKFYLFPVEEYALSKQNGYLYDLKNQIKEGDTIALEEVISDKILIRKKIAENWFEYQEK